MVIGYRKRYSVGGGDPHAGRKRIRSSDCYD
ncbi:hypothetical protein L915_02486 [Phytophthora nicotianae]|uniref:Uncharacterized protein n=1 Tax=Phytophthora nicotianae TaxID=4792 RepID=W2HGW4_PHYNI|nr:hypothetical protein L915_02486 [Phytophthora nicotianae]